MQPKNNPTIQYTGTYMSYSARVASVARSYGGDLVGATNVSGVRTRQIPELGIPDLPGARCKGVEDPELWFPGPGAGGRQKATQAREICDGCPARERCLEWALEWDRAHPDYYDRIQGIWGGTSEADRKKILKETNAA